MDVAVLSPHTDDSELSAGGTINRLQRDGHDIHYVAFSTCDESLPAGKQGVLRREFESVMEFVDPTEYYVFDYVVRRFNERRQDILEDLVALREELDPDLIIGPSTSDHHQDHTVVAKEMIRAFKSGPSIIAYEQPWNTTSFDTDLFSPLTAADLDSKLTQLSQYDSQIEKGRPYFEEEFIRGLARVRGLQGNARYAEAFEVVRWLL
ncbi:PIG-L deacetylase family protein [Halorarum halobium]|uniref:PIG-L deacetylase family protein n=1 Tax=Halorarum halobium TaxID=3075121 RepID=UPI0028AAF4C2|nr:PIG-L family deacetylase [Halobaculum sp. XH14]